MVKQAKVSPKKSKQRQQSPKRAHSEVTETA